MGSQKIERDCTSEEWVSDFNAKYGILRSHYEESFQEDLYVDIFGSLEKKCNLLVNDFLKKNNIGFNSLIDYMEEHSTVFIYTQLFDSYCNGNYHFRGLDALNSMKCIVVDIDDVNSNNISDVISRISNIPIKPNYVVNSGNGLHLYFVFSALHHVKSSIGLMAYADGIGPSMCQISNVIYLEEYDHYLSLYKKVKNGMIGWFDKVSTTFADTNNHLVQPIRLFGSKTKNPSCYTQIFKVTNIKNSFQDIASLFGVDIPDEDDAVTFEKLCNSIQSKKYREKRKLDLALATSQCKRTAIKDYHFNFDDFINRVFTEEQEYLNSDEYKAFQQYVLEDNQRKAKEREDKSVKYNRKNAQAKGCLSQYQQFKDMVYKVAKVGNRRNCLYVFWHKSHSLIKDEKVITSDFNELANHLQVLSNSDKLHDKQISSITEQTPIHLTNDTVSKYLGFNFKYERKQEKVRIEKKETTKAKRADLNQLIIQHAERYFQSNHKPSYRGLSQYLEEQGIIRSHKTLSVMHELRAMKSMYSV